VAQDERHLLQWINDIRSKPMGDDLMIEIIHLTHAPEYVYIGMSLYIFHIHCMMPW